MPFPPNQEAVLVKLQADGNVADFTPAKIDQIAEGIATGAGVNTSSVKVEVTAGSVNIYGTIIPPAGKTAAQINTAVANNLGTAAQANSALADAGVTVTSAPTVETTNTDTVNQAVASDNSAWVDRQIGASVALGTGVLVAIIVVPIIVVGCLLSLIIYWWCCKNQRKLIVVNASA